MSTVIMKGGCFCGRVRYETTGAPFHDLLPAEIDVTICSLDDPESVRPKDETWVSSKVGWVLLDRRLPHHRSGAQGR